MAAAKKVKSAKQRAAPKRAARVSLPDALAEAGWREADAALAEALALCDEAMNAGSARARADALTLLEQALARAARKRGMARTGQLGADEAFAGDVHELVGAARAPKRVRIVARGVERGGETLVKQRAAPARARRS